MIVWLVTVTVCDRHIWYHDNPKPKSKIKNKIENKIKMRKKMKIK